MWYLTITMKIRTSDILKGGWRKSFNWVGIYIRYTKVRITALHLKRPTVASSIGLHVNVFRLICIKFKVFEINKKCLFNHWFNDQNINIFASLIRDKSKWLNISWNIKTKKMIWKQSTKKKNKKKTPTRRQFWRQAWRAIKCVSY